MNKLTTLKNNLTFTNEIVELIHSTKQRMVVAVNAELTSLYWQVGKRINDYLLQGERAKYGEDIIPQLSRSLTEQFGKGWSKRNLAQMVKFATIFPDIQILQTLSAKLKNLRHSSETSAIRGWNNGCI